MSGDAFGLSIGEPDFDSAEQAAMVMEMTQAMLDYNAKVIAIAEKYAKARGAALEQEIEATRAAWQEEQERL